jgi:hypothetical protein
MKYRTSLLAAVILAFSTALPQGTIAQTAPQAGTATAGNLFGLQISPNKNQSSAQQSTDESACYQTAKTKSGYDPAAMSPAPSPAGTTAMSNAGAPTGVLGNAETHYLQAPAQTQQGQSMKGFKKSFRKCMKTKGYTVKSGG